MWTVRFTKVKQFPTTAFEINFHLNGDSFSLVLAWIMSCTNTNGSKLDGVSELNIWTILRAAYNN